MAKAEDTFVEHGLIQWDITQHTGIWKYKWCLYSGVDVTLVAVGWTETLSEALSEVAKAASTRVILG